MKSTLLVKSMPGVLCPKEGALREYVSDAFPENVPDTSYYRRRIEDGSLVVVSALREETKKKGNRK